MYRNLQRLWLASLILVLLPSLRLVASPIDQFGLGPDGASLGNSNIASPNPAYSAYYNPAGVVEKGSKLGVGLVRVNWDLKDLNEGYRSSPDAVLPMDNYQASKARNLDAMSFGFQKNLSPNIGFGIAGLVPKEILAINGSSGDEVQYLTYSNRRTKPEIYTALAIQHPTGLAVGIGSYVTLKATGDVQAGVSNEESRGRMNLATKTVVIPHFGMRFRRPVWDGQLSMGVFFRESHTTDVDLDTEFVLANDTFRLPTEIQSNLAAFHDPRVVRTGVSFQKRDYAISFAYEITDWSDFEPAVLELSGDDLATLTGGSSIPTQTAFGTSKALKIGLSYVIPSLYKGTTMRVGFEDHSGASSSEETVRTQVVDVARRTFGLGVGMVLLKGQDKNEGSDLSVDLTFQHSQLRNKTFSTPEGKRFTAGGTIQGFMGGISRAF